jgi:hypothetical protein
VPGQYQKPANLGVNIMHFGHAFRYVLLTMAVVLSADSISAQENAGKGTPVIRDGAPSGSEIAAAARAGSLDAGNTATATVLGKQFRFTPIRVPQGGTKPTSATGFAGVLENGAAGDETGLPPGRYNLFVSNVGGQWKAYAESGGRIVREAIRVSNANLARGAKPQFEERGWCVIVWTLWTDGWYLYSTVRRICF